MLWSLLLVVALEQHSTHCDFESRVR